MFRSLLLRPRLLVHSNVLPRLSVPCRAFNSSVVLLKKKSKKAEKEQVVESSEVPEIDFDKVAVKLQAVIDKFAKQANDSKLGKSNPQIFDHLSVQTPDGELPYTAVAQTAVKGRNFMMTVFDPANVKHVVNAVLASDLNLNPMLDPSNKQMLKVPLPPVTTESKKETVKQLKTVFEKYKNGPAGSSKNSATLSAIRAEIKAQVAKKKKMTDGEAELWNTYEKLHKTYVDKLGAVFKAAETAIMK